MLVPQKLVRYLAVMVLVFTTGKCQEKESRRAVAEYQLMHDRSRTMQSLKRLIWLSSAIESLHTAQTRSDLFSPTNAHHMVPAASAAAAAGSLQPAQVEDQQKVAVESLLRDFFYPHLIRMPEREP